MRSREKSDIFHEDGGVTASSQLLYYFVSFCHANNNECGRSALGAQWPYEHRGDAMTSQTTTYNLYASATDNLQSSCGNADHTALLWRPYGDPSGYIRKLNDSFCFVHTQSVHHRSAFYAIPMHQLVMPMPCCDNAFNSFWCTSLQIFLGHSGIAVKTQP